MLCSAGTGHGPLFGSKSERVNAMLQVSVHALTYLTFSRSARRVILAATGSARSFAPGNGGVSQRRHRVCFLGSRASLAHTHSLLFARHLLHLFVHCFTLLDQLVQNGYNSFNFLVSGCAIHFGDELVEFGLLILPV
jgi:hypothetical protein